MSWRTGASIFVQAWPTIKKEITDKDELKSFTKEFLAIFDKRDVDLYDLVDSLEDTELADIISVYQDEKYS